MWQDLYDSVVKNRKRDEWYVLQRIEDVIDGGIYGSADGLVKVMEKSTRPNEVFAKVIVSTNGDIHKGDVFSYRYDELYRGADNKWANWKLEGLKDYILGQARHKNIDDINVKPSLENYIYEDSLDDEEVNDLIRKALSSAKKIAGNKSRKKSEIKQAQDVVKWIIGVQRTWRKEKSLHPNVIVSLMRTVAGTSSKNIKGWGYRTFGFKSSPDGKVPSDFSNTSEVFNEAVTESFPSGKDCAATQRANEYDGGVELQEGRGLSDAVIKSSALMVKRWIITKGKEGNVSAQINGLASLILFDMALSDRGQSIMSKALAMSGLFREDTNEQKI